MTYQVKSVEYPSEVPNLTAMTFQFTITCPDNGSISLDPFSTTVIVFDILAAVSNVSDTIKSVSLPTATISPAGCFTITWTVKR